MVSFFRASMVTVIIIVVFVAAGGGIAILYQRNLRRRMAAALDGAERVLEPRPARIRNGTALEGICRGHAILIEFAKDGNKQRCSHVRVELPPRPFALELRRLGFLEGWRIEHGQAVDVKLGDPSFDEQWVVEGAPADVVRRVLSPELRRRLHALDFDQLRQPGDRLLELRARGWRLEPRWVAESVDVMASLSDAIAPAFAASEREIAASSLA